MFLLSYSASIGKAPRTKRLAIEYGMRILGPECVKPFPDLIPII